MLPHCSKPNAQKIFTLRKLAVVAENDELAVFEELLPPVIGLAGPRWGLLLALFQLEVAVRVWHFNLPNEPTRFQTEATALVPFITSDTKLSILFGSKKLSKTFFGFFFHLFFSFFIFSTV
jgi:hypothetical protein